VAANVQTASGKRIAKRAWVVKKVNGLRVGVIGVLMNDLAERYSTPEKMGAYRTIPPAEAVRKHIGKLRRKSDVIVVLAHLSPSDAEAILREVPEVHAVVNGHDHSGQPELVRAGSGVVVRAKGYGVEVGRLRLTFDKQARRITNADWTKIPVDASVPPAPDVAQSVASWESRVAEMVDEVIGEAKRDFATRDENRVWIERALKESLGVDYAYMNPGGIRDSIRAGVIRKRHIWTIMPFDNLMVRGTFRGRDLPKVITDRFPVEADQQYTIAVPDFVAQTDSAPGRVGGWGLTFSKDGPMLRDLLIAWVQKQKVLN
jgi:2',3'-cyclic-nucleotide 2'-phosphodiesterase (5'-nucleotidase family)